MNRYLLAFSLLFVFTGSQAQSGPWIHGHTMWGIRNGIVVGFWPGAIENLKQSSNGGPRGLLRIGYEYMGLIYHINYIAIEMW